MLKPIFLLSALLLFVACDLGTDDTTDNETAALRASCTIDSISIEVGGTVGDWTTACFLHLRNGDTDMVYNFGVSPQQCPESYTVDGTTHLVAVGEVSGKCMARHAD